MTCTRPSNSFRTLAGVPVHYDRLPPQFSYGSKGRPQAFFAQQAFETLLDQTFAEMWQHCPLGRAAIILTAGAWVCKSGTHGRGIAFDLDGIWWGERLVLADNYPTDSAAYLGIEAVLRKHLGTVLNYRFDRAHQDHWHVDSGTAVGFRRVRSVVLFVQMAAGKLFDRTVKVDGAIGPETRGAVRAILAELGLATAAQMNGPSDIDAQLTRHWMAFLDAAAEQGLAVLAPADDRFAEPNPPQLLQQALDLLTDALQEHPGRKQVEQAVQRFAEHPRVAALLAEFQ